MRNRRRGLVVLGAAILGAGALLAVGTAGEFAGALRPPRHHLRASDLSAAGWHDDLSCVISGSPRYFRVYVPAALPSRPPLVVLLHGGRQSMRKIFGANAGATRAWPVLAEESGFLLIIPNGINADTGDPYGDSQNWHDCRAMGSTGSTADDVAFVSALVGWASSTYRIDRARVYATGASNGGGMAYRLAIERPDLLAAGAVFIMNLARNGDCGPPHTPVPILICNGTTDPLVPWNGGVVAYSRGEVVSAAETLAAWRTANRTATEPAEEIHHPDLDPGDGCSVTTWRYLPAPPGSGAEVVLSMVTGGGHTVPTRAYPVPAWLLSLSGLGNQNRDIEGARHAWAFLSRQRLASPPP